jgi:ribosomal protein S18 acetylase RimI-like enzyme
MIEPYRPEYFADLVRFVSAIQEHERVTVPDLKTGDEIGKVYAQHLLAMVKQNNGHILVARNNRVFIGMICAWVTEDDDLLLRDDKRKHAYVSDIFVIEARRRKKIGQALLKEIENVMRQQGCQRMRICSKASNVPAITFYKGNGYIPYETTFSKEI